MVLDSEDISSISFCLRYKRKQSFLEPCLHLTSVYVSVLVLPYIQIEETWPQNIKKKF